MTIGCISGLRYIPLVGLIAFAALRAIADPLPVATSQKTVAHGFSFPEGPAVSRNGRFLYCVNVQKAWISRVALRKGDVNDSTRDWARQWRHVGA